MNRRLPRTAQGLAPSRVRSTLFAAAGVVAVLTVSGCQYTSTIQTDRPYEPADGVSSQVGDLQVRNLLIVAGAKGGKSNLVGMTANPTDRPGQVSFALAGGEQIRLMVPAQGTAQLSTPDKLVSAGSVTVIPGALVPVQVSSPSGGTVTLQVPVKYPQGPYLPYAPAGFTPAPEPTASPEAAEH